MDYWIFIFFIKLDSLMIVLMTWLLFDYFDNCIYENHICDCHKCDNRTYDNQLSFEYWISRIDLKVNLKLCLN